MFNDHYVNTMQKTSSIAPSILGDPLNLGLENKTGNLIIENSYYKYSIVKIKEMQMKQFPLISKGYSRR